MDKATRGNLLVEQEELQKSIATMQRQLSEAGNIYSYLGQALQSQPENLVFSNAPAPLGNIPTHLLSTSGLDWNKIPDKAEVAQRIQDLRAAVSRLSSVQGRLKEPLTD